MDFDVIDADGHVTESWEQIARRLDEPFRRRPLQTPFYPQDGWDRRLLGTKGDWAGDAKSWTAALADGGMSAAVLFPTLSLYPAFVRDPDWAVALARAYNTYASDFPHWDHSFPKWIAELKGRPDLSDAQKRKVLADNARRLYHLA